MSGIEVAGLVLGAFPLIITALEKWHDTAILVEEWWQVRREYQECVDRIGIEHLEFESSLKECLLPHVGMMDDHEMDLLISDPGGPEWKKLNLQHKLTKRSLDLYISTINRMNSTMESIKRRVSKMEFRDLLDHDSNVYFPHIYNFQVIESDGHFQTPRQSTPRTAFSKTKAKVDYERNRVGFTFGKSTRTRLFDDIRKCNEDLRRIFKAQERIATATMVGRDVTAKKGMTKSMGAFFLHANCVYGLLCSAWTCTCWNFHRANLLLCHRITREIRLDILFNFDHVTDGVQSKPWTYQETMIRKTDPASNQSSISVPVPAMHSKASSRAGKVTSERPSAAGKAPQKSALVLRQNTNSGNSKKESSVSWDTAAPSIETQIKDFCSSIAAGTNRCFGYLENDENRYLVHPTPTSDQKLPDSPATVSLEELLPPQGRCALSRRKRYYLAWTIASSHIQLHSTPWLGEQWTKRDIILPKKTDEVDELHPYISRGFENTKCTPTPFDPTFSTLGILLMELCYGRPFEDTEAWRKHTPPTGHNDISQMAAAWEWWKDVDAEAGDEYAEAIKWCLTKFSGVDKDPKWKQDLFKNVVTPLKKCYEAIGGPVAF